MSIADYFESGEMREHKGAFRNLVMIALSDGVVSVEEEAFLSKMAKKLDLTDAEVSEIRNNPTKYPIYPPHDKEDRIDRMISLVSMVMADGEVDSREMDTLNRLAVGLGYSEEKAAEVSNKIFHHLRIGMGREEILDDLMGSR